MSFLGQARGSLAVTGNSDPDKENIYMPQVSVIDLTLLLGVSDLFPVKAGCSLNKSDVTILTDKNNSFLWSLTMIIDKKK